MNPIRPATFSSDNLADGRWLEAPSQRSFRDLFRSTGTPTGTRFPAAIVGFSARPGLAGIAEMVAAGVSQAGLNVFLSDAPTPIIALSRAICNRGMSLGLYLDETATGEFILFPLGNNGGPATGLDLPEMPSVPLEKPGVVGTTDITTTYLSGLKELLDPFPEAKPRAAEIQSPFDLIARRFGERPEYRILWERAENGPVAVISPDGQGLSFLIPPGENWTTREIAQTVGEYLTLVRRTNGTVVAPHGVQPLKLGEAQHISVVGDSLEMSCQAGYIDLLLGWWEPGIIAHQGNGPYGDAYLTLAYLLEALGARQS